MGRVIAKLRRFMNLGEYIRGSRFVVKMDLSPFVAFLLIGSVGTLSNAQDFSAQEILDNSDSRYSYLTTISDAMDTGQIRKLVLSSDDNASILAAWESVRRQKSDRTIPRDEIMKFIGFIQGRLRMELTDTWRKSLLVAFANLSRDDRNKLLDDVLKVKSELSAAAQAKLEVRAENLVIKLDATGKASTFEILAKRPESVKLHGGAIVAIQSDSKYAYVAEFSNGFGNFPVHAFDLETATIKWTAQVFGEYPPQLGGRPIRVVEIFADESRLFILGSGNFVFLEVFDRTSGRPLVRFAAISPKW
jgi:hypothetical protein